MSRGKKVAVCKPGNRLSLGNASAGTLIMDFPASRTIRNKFKPSSWWTSILAAGVKTYGFQDWLRLISALFGKTDARVGQGESKEKISRTYSSYITETIYPLNSNFPTSIPPF